MRTLVFLIGLLAAQAWPGPSPAVLASRALTAAKFDRCDVRLAWRAGRAADG